MHILSKLVIELSLDSAGTDALPRVKAAPRPTPSYRRLHDPTTPLPGLGPISLEETAIDRSLKRGFLDISEFAAVREKGVPN